MSARKRVAVVGAGVSGLCGVKSCLEEELEPVCFEQYDNIGGTWYYTAEYREGQGARIYDHLTANTSKDFFSYSDFPFPREDPVIPSYRDIFRYLNSYCDHFGLRKYIHLNTKVKKISKADDYETTGKWLVETEDSVKGTVKHIFDFVMVCAGYQVQPVYPDIPGMNLFQGTIEHSMTFKDGRKYKDHRVLVVGNGFSAADVATYTSEYASQVSLSVGDGMLILPKTLKNGLPYDHLFFTRAMFRNPTKLVQFSKDIANERLDHDKAGLTPSCPDSKIKYCVNDLLQIQIYTGKVKIAPRLVRLGPREAELENGLILRDLDCVIFGTGFRRNLDFLENDNKGGTDKLTLYKMMFPVQLPKYTLAIIGCVYTDGTFPLLPDLQSRIAARVFVGKHHLPSKDEMLRDVDRWNAMIFKRHGKYKYLMSNMLFRDELADELGVSPSWWDLIKAGPRLAYLYYYGPALPYHSRLWGPHQWSGARQAIEDALQYGHFTIQPRQTIAKSNRSTKRTVFWAFVVALSAIIIGVWVFSGKYFPNRSR